MTVTDQVAAFLAAGPAVEQPPSETPEQEFDRWQKLAQRLNTEAEYRRKEAAEIDLLAAEYDGFTPWNGPYRDYLNTARELLDRLADKAEEYAGVCEDYAKDINPQAFGLCGTCKGATVIVVCPDHAGMCSHTNDREWECPTCGGSGSAA